MLEDFIKTKFLVIPTKDTKGEIVQKPLREFIKQSLKNYFSNFSCQECKSNLYALVLSELERPLLDVIMQYTRGNQTKAAEIMGINRSTLRKKLRKYSMH